MSNELISIIIPVYNVKNYLKRCLDSVMEQTYQNLEIILVDDGSTDSSGKICDEYARRDNRIIVIHKENGGVSSARNKGIESAKGDYIGFVDSDDYIEKNMYEALYKEAIKSEADIVMCNYFVETEKHKNEHYVDKQMDLFNKEQFYDKLIDNYFKGFLPTKLYKRRMIYAKNEVNLLNENVHIYEDLLFLANIARNGKKFVFINQPLYHYCVRMDSAFRSQYHTKQLSALEAMDGILKIVEQENSQVVIKYKKAYLDVALFLLEKYCLSDNPSKEEKQYIKSCIDKYYKEILEDKNIILKKKIEIRMQYKFPRLVGGLKNIYHKMKYK